MQQNNQTQQKKGNCLVLILDGFGVGAMPDVLTSRPQDRNSNTALHLLEQKQNISLPALSRLGLANLLEREFENLPFDDRAVYGKAMLQHEGADTFFGHQEIMGTRPETPYGEPFCRCINEVEAALQHKGYLVTRQGDGKQELLIVNQSLTIGDNMECDAGQAFNVSAALDDICFEQVVKVGQIVREIAIVPRVIVFGGRGISIKNLLSAMESRNEYIGVNAPLSGVYQNDYHCIHLGYGVDKTTQIPTILGQCGIEVFLIGKVADIVSNEYGISLPMVNTKDVMNQMHERLVSQKNSFICANVQQTDLCGHRQNVEEYANHIKQADDGLLAIMASMTREDLLIVMADHGNDPTIGHPNHTREFAPILVYGKNLKATALGTRSSLADVGATVADYFSICPPQHGQSFLPLLFG